MLAGSADYQQLALDIAKSHERKEEIEVNLKIESEELRKNLEAKREEFENRIGKCFDFIKEDIILDGKAIVDSFRKYKEELTESLASDNPGTVPGKKLIFKSLNTRLAILKGGQITKEGHKRLCFADLDILDQNLLLRSVLSKVDLQDGTVVRLED